MIEIERVIDRSDRAAAWVIGVERVRDRSERVKGRLE